MLEIDRIHECFIELMIQQESLYRLLEYITKKKQTQMKCHSKPFIELGPFLTFVHIVLKRICYKMDTTYLIYRIVGLFVVLFSVGTIFHFIRPREIVLHTLNDTIFEEKVFETEIYLGRIRRMIGKSTVEYDNDSHLLKSKTEERHSFRPPCVGLRYVKG